MENENKITLTDLQVEEKYNNTVIINFNGKEIEIKDYLPTQDKYLFAQLLASLCLENNDRVCNNLKKKVWRAISILKLYTNIEISIPEGTIEEIYQFYDRLNQSGLIDKAIGAIPFKEIAELDEIIDNTINATLTYNMSGYGVISEITNLFRDVNFDSFSELLTLYNEGRIKELPKDEDEEPVDNTDTGVLSELEVGEKETEKTTE